MGRTKKKLSGINTDRETPLAYRRKLGSHTRIEDGKRVLYKTGDVMLCADASELRGHKSAWELVEGPQDATPETAEIDPELGEDADKIDAGGEGPGDENPKPVLLEKKHRQFGIWDVFNIETGERVNETDLNREQADALVAGDAADEVTE